MKNPIPGMSKCQDAQRRARECIPGVSQLLSKRPDQFSEGVWPGYFRSASGVEVEDLDGNRYTDFSIGGIGATVLGYRDPVVDAAVHRVVDMGVATSLSCEEEVELAEKLVGLHPWAQMVRFTRGGGEAMAMAIRIARAATGRDTVLFCGYHGWHDWYLSVNLAGEGLSGHLLPGLSPTGIPGGLKGSAHPFAYNSLDTLDAAVAKAGGKVAAIVMEPLRNQQPAPGFLEGVRARATELGAVLVFDEISSGFRIALGGAHLCFGVEPDMAVFGKALGNGYAINAVIGRREVMEAASASFISSTNWTERIGPAAALTTLARFKDLRVCEHLVAIGRRVQDGWRSLADRHGVSISVGGMEPLSHFTFAEDHLVRKAFLVQEMIRRGYLASTTFYAMYPHTESMVDAYLAALDEVFAEMAAAGAGLGRLLEGKPAAPGFARLT